jgi:hypothetical protein
MQAESSVTLHWIAELRFEQTHPNHGWRSKRRILVLLHEHNGEPLLRLQIQSFYDYNRQNFGGVSLSALENVTDQASRLTTPLIDAWQKLQSRLLQLPAKDTAGLIRTILRPVPDAQAVSTAIVDVVGRLLDLDDEAGRQIIVSSLRQALFGTTELRVVTGVVNPDGGAVCFAEAETVGARLRRGDMLDEADVRAARQWLLWAPLALGFWGPTKAMLKWLDPAQSAHEFGVALGRLGFAHVVGRRAVDESHQVMLLVAYGFSALEQDQSPVGQGSYRNLAVHGVSGQTLQYVLRRTRRQIAALRTVSPRAFTTTASSVLLEWDASVGRGMGSYAETRIGADAVSNFILTGKFRQIDPLSPRREARELDATHPHCEQWALSPDHLEDLLASVQYSPTVFAFAAQMADSFGLALPPWSPRTFSLAVRSGNEKLVASALAAWVELPTLCDWSSPDVIEILVRKANLEALLQFLTSDTEFEGRATSVWQLRLTLSKTVHALRPEDARSVALIRVLSTLILKSMQDAAPEGEKFGPWSPSDLASLPAENLAFALRVDQGTVDAVAPWRELFVRAVTTNWALLVGLVMALSTAPSRTDEDSADFLYRIVEESLRSRFALDAPFDLRALVFADGDIRDVVWRAVANLSAKDIGRLAADSVSLAIASDEEREAALSEKIERLGADRVALLEADVLLRLLTHPALAEQDRRDALVGALAARWRENSTWENHPPAQLATPGVLRALWESIGALGQDDVWTVVGDSRLLLKVVGDSVAAAQIPKAANGQIRIMIDYARHNPGRFLLDPWFGVAIASMPSAEAHSVGIEGLTTANRLKDVWLVLAETGTHAALEAAELHVRSLQHAAERARAVLSALDSRVLTVRLLGFRLMHELPDPLEHNLWAHLVHSDAADVIDRAASYFQHKPAEQIDGLEAFDRRVLVSRRRHRHAKEAVKERVQMSATNATMHPDHLDALMELGQSVSKRDREWALQQLAVLALNGMASEQLTIDLLSEKGSAQW